VRRPWTIGLLALGALVPGCSLLVSTSDLAGKRQAGAPSPEGGTVSNEPGAEAGTTPTTTPQIEAGADAGDGGPLTGDPSLVGAWSFDETSGNTSADLSGHGHTASLLGPSFAPGGVRAGCVKLAGDAGFVAVEDFSGPGFPRTGTLSIWFRWSSMDPANEYSVLEGFGTTYDHVFLRHANGDSLGTFQVGFQPNGADYAFEDDFPVAQDHWSHVVFSWDETAKQGATYVDGAPRLREAYTAPFAPTGEHFHLGMYLDGAIDEVRLYNRALSTAEATALP
jgi:hypothetical protein